ncbi:MAG: SpoIIE family protein phosphatase [Planctomycetota bacterium]|nr:SpoIIE family protein phosphatase [Planctomycetota bacterium]MDG2144701.1 SpoIIE family protein phosphatase [Planctomycetota bacterium]
MARSNDVRVKGLGLGARFALAMTVALAVVMVAAGYWIHSSADNLAAKGRDFALAGGIELTLDDPDYEREITGWLVPGFHGVQVFNVTYGGGKKALLYRTERNGRKTEWLVPLEKESLGSKLAKVIGIIILLVILAGAGVSMFVAGQVTGPLRRIVDDIRQIARGNFGHRTRAKGGGEIALLARAIDRMGADLEGARESELELNMRERELELASGVREALMPFGTPDLAGYDIRSSHLPSGELLGDFYDFIELEDGRVGVLICDVSGTGVPAALVGATARAYLAAELARGGDVAESFKQVNRTLQQDVRRGMYVTAFYVLVDPHQATAQVVCSGHKVPLLHYRAAEKKLRKVHPGGLALGFDKGPVFDRSLEVVELDLAVGDRLMLSNQGPVQVPNKAGEELGEAQWFRAFGRAASLPTPKFLRALRACIDDFADGEPIPFDVSIITVLRESD